MNLASKRLAATVVTIASLGIFNNFVAGAFWPFSSSCDNAQKCKEKLDKSCALIGEKESKCHEEFASLYDIIDKMTNDIKELRDSQSIAEGIVTKLTLAYEEWKQDDFRIDTQYHTNYVLLKKKLSDQNRVVEQNEQLVKDDIKVIGKLLNTQRVKDEYVSSIKDAIDAYYKYNMAVAKEDVDESE